MKNLHTHAIFALAFMLGVAAPAVAIINTQSASAAEQIVDESGEVIVIDTVAKLQDAINNNSGVTIKLDADLAGDKTANGALLTIDHDTTIDLNGHSITSNSGTAILITKGIVTLTGNGTIHGKGNAIGISGATSVVNGVYSKVLVDTNVTLISDTLYGITVAPAVSGNHECYGVVIDFRGTITNTGYGIYVNGMVNDTQNQPQITIADGAHITTTTATDATPIYAAGSSVWTVGRATLIGNAAVAVKSGTMTFNNTTVSIIGDVVKDPTPMGKNIDGISSAFQLEHTLPYAGDIVLTINGGTYSSAKHDVFHEYGQADQRSALTPAKITITGGTFTAGDDHAIFGGNYSDTDITITGGTFHGNDVDTFKANGYLANNYIINSNGTVVLATSGGSSSSRPGTTTPSDTTKPSDPNDSKDPSAALPDTGINQGIGVISAVGTIVPLMIGAGILFSLYSKRLHKNRQAEIINDMVTAIDAQPVTIETADEPVIERFEAVAIDRPATPEVTPVDTFIKRR